MSWCESTNFEECITKIPEYFIEHVLNEYGYKINKTQFQITATYYAGAFHNAGYSSIITIIKENEFLKCKNQEKATAPIVKHGKLSEIIQEAEKLYNLSQDKDFQEKLIKQCDCLLKKYNHYQEKSENVSFLKKKSLKKETQKIYDEYISYKKLYDLFQKSK